MGRYSLYLLMHCDLQRSQLGLIGEGARLQATQAQMSVSQHKGQPARISLVQRARNEIGVRIPDVLQGLRQTLTGQAGSTLAALPRGNEGLETLRSQLAERLVVTSSVAYALLTQPESEWDDNARHTWSLLSTGYPAECAQLASGKTHLEAMAGISQTEHMLDQVRGRKRAITEEKINAFLDDQAKALRGYMDGAPEAVRRNREEIVNAKAGDLEEKLNAMQRFREAAVRATNVAVGDIAEDAGEGLRRQINSKVQELFSGVQNTAEQSKDYEVEYTDPSSLRKFASALSFGLISAERKSTTVNTIDATKIRSALEGFHASFSTQITTVVDNTRQGLRKKIEAGILAALREHKVVNDRDIDTSHNRGKRSTG